MPELERVKNVRSGRARSLGRMTGLQFCEMIILQNSGIVTSKDLYQEALKEGF